VEILKKAVYFSAKKNWHLIHRESMSSDCYKEITVFRANRFNVIIISDFYQPHQLWPFFWQASKPINGSNMTLAFISYQTADRKIAGEIKALLKKEGIESFLAHEDIAVSEEWRLEILRVIKKANIFVAIVTEKYIGSVWCVQEAGIAAAISKLTPICLLFDNSTPPGFLQAVQGRRCRNGAVTLSDLLPGLVKAAPDIVLNNLISIILKSSSFREAEGNYSNIIPYINKLSPDQAKRLLEKGCENGQVMHASLCAKEYIPKVLAKHDKAISKELNLKIRSVCDQYRE
jgi:hypothetical protein